MGDENLTDFPQGEEPTAPEVSCRNSKKVILSLVIIALVCLGGYFLVASDIVHLGERVTPTPTTPMPTSTPTPTTITFQTLPTPADMTGWTESTYVNVEGFPWTFWYPPTWEEVNPSGRPGDFVYKPKAEVNNFGLSMMINLNETTIDEAISRLSQVGEEFSKKQFVKIDGHNAVITYRKTSNLINGPYWHISASVEGINGNLFSLTATYIDSKGIGQYPYKQEVLDIISTLEFDG